MLTPFDAFADPAPRASRTSINTAASIEATVSMSGQGRPSGRICPLARRKATIPTATARIHAIPPVRK